MGLSVSTVAGSLFSREQKKRRQPVTLSEDSLNLLNPERPGGGFHPNTTCKMHGVNQPASPASPLESKFKGRRIKRSYKQKNPTRYPPPFHLGPSGKKTPNLYCQKSSFLWREYKSPAPSIILILTENSP